MKFSATVFALSGLALVNADCISDCESAAASDLGCDLSDVSGCVCQTGFPLSAKACLYEDTACGKTYVASFYEEWNTACAGATTTAAVTAAATTASTTDLASNSASTDCLAACESTVASALGCDASDVSGCFCLDDFATQAKSCLYSSSCSSDVSGFYSAYDSACAGTTVGTAATVASTIAAFSTSSTPSQAANGTTTSVAPVAVNSANGQGVPFSIAAVVACLGIAAVY